MKLRYPLLLLTLALFFAASSIGSAGDDDGSSDDVVLPDTGSVGGPSRDLDPLEAAMWLRGQQLFDKDFHIADGLGTPDLNADSCRSCHHVPVIGGAGGLDLNVLRFARDNGGSGSFMDLPGGQVMSKLRPPMDISREEYDPNTADLFEQRQTPTTFGSGLIDSIPDGEILLREDPMDLDGDDVAGFARILDVGGGMTEVGRFGWKAQIPHVRDFIRDAMAGECGITTPGDGIRPFGLRTDEDAVGDPELTQEGIDDMAFYLGNLAAPQRKNPTDPQVIQGELIFDDIGCDRCHVPVLMGDDGPVPLYSDLLLHNIWGDAVRMMSEDGAPSGYFRTPPLWGISDTAPYLHDGRAEGLRNAILLHRNEAKSSRTMYRALDRDEKNALIAFLEDL